MAPLRLIILASTLLALSGCSAFSPEPSTQTFEGVAQFGFEVSSFTPCGSSEQWWVVGQTAGELYERVLEVQPEMYGRALVRIKGIASRRGRYGHMSVYTRELRVESVLSVQAGTCE